MKVSFKHLGMIASVAIVAVVCVLAVNSQPSQAANGGDSNDSNVGGCSDRGTNCTRWGITWVQQPLDEFLASAERVGLTASQKQDMIDACAGMVNPTVNRLAYVDFANGGEIQLGSVSGLISNDRADRNNAVYVDPSTIPGGMTAAEAQALFEYALSIGVNMEYGWDQMAIFAFDQAWQDCGTDSACLNRVVEEIRTETETNGDGDSAMAYFQSKTIIDVGDGIPEGPQDSGWDGHVAIEFSTDSPSVTVNFSHTLEYQPNGFTLGGEDVFTTSGTAGGISNPPAIADVEDSTNNFTPYTITTGGGGSFGRYTTSSGSQTFSGISQTVSLAPGETQTVCSYISYSNKFANMKSKKHITVKHVDGVQDDPDTPDVNEYVAEVPEESHFDWYLSGYSGSGSSGACATITRPSEPTGGPENPNPGADNPNGNPGSNIMYAGESTDLKWWLDAQTWDVRRLMERQITGHLVSVIPGNESRFFTGYPRSSSSPYDYYSGSYIVDRHIFNNENLNHSPDSYHEQPTVVVPDQVGYKYCNSGGYRYEFWYSINGNWSRDNRPGKNYWYVYDASCRTISKKPSVAIWNNGIMTTGGVTTSSSPRFDNTRIGILAVNGGSRTLYGSWAEYLATIGRDVNYFTSGASLAIGSRTVSSPKSDPLNTSNSPLTIANQGILGSSGIRNNTTFRTRLTTYLENQAERPGGNTLAGLSNVNSTRILRYDNGLKITGDIITNPGNYSSIYDVPQVIIFVHGGDVEISSDVTRIDAWLIVDDGKVNTCSEFRSRETESDAIDRLRPNGNYCAKQLVFNGPVMAQGLTLNRSFGSDHLASRTGTFGAAPAKWNPGEVFNMRTDVYLWAYAQAGRYQSSYTESYFRELAPRY